MFTLEDNRKKLYQWDSNVKLLVNDSGKLDEVHFSADGSDKALVVKVTRTSTESYVIIPNILLQKHYDISVYGFTFGESGNHTLTMLVIPVEKRARPADYIYTESEVYSLEKLAEEVKGIKSSNVPGVTSADNGKFLRVVNGVWTVATVENAEGVSF